MIVPQITESLPELHSLTREQLAVVDQIINERSRTARKHARLTSEMQKFAAQGNLESFRDVERQAREIAELIGSYTLAISAALDAFRAMNQRAQLSATPARHF